MRGCDGWQHPPRIDWARSTVPAALCGIVWRANDDGADAFMFRGGPDCYPTKRQAANDE